MPNGFWDRILHVDLATGATRVERLGAEFWRAYLGGRSLIAHELLTEVPAGADPLGPDNVLVFAAGVLTGLPFPGSARHSVGARSPLTGGFGEAEAGGYWGSELRLAGWDALCVHGRAERPVYLWIKDDAVEVRDAAQLWGQETGAVEDAIRAELGDRLIRVAQTGIAGENLVKYALIANDLNDVAGRTGLGAVMGSKRLKAIAVRGSHKVPVADPAPIQQVAKWVIATMDGKHNRFHYYGTGAIMKGKHLEGHLIVRNFQDGQWDPVEQIDALAIKERYAERQTGCYACAVRCKKRVRVEQPERYATEPRYGGPEYETLAALGTNLAVDNLPLLLRANQRLSQLGLDSISTGGTIAWATECYQRGLLTAQDTGGLALTWGDGDTALQLIELIARREGFGALLAEGTLRAARAIGRGTERYAVQVKGLELGMHDPRGVPELVRNYPVTPTGGDHTSAAHPRTSLRNTVGLCHFLQYDEATVVDLVRAATGWDVGKDELRTVAARGLTMARLFNLREGLTRDDDRLPARLHEPIRTGPLSERRLAEEEVAAAVQEYYRQQGWDERGVPRPETIAGLGLQRYAPAS
ncbi:MAG: aldehyde ferredoxin oxidoreductase family protein [Chloroflexi bacterium]|nr:aldehyde ferredoxin oxidoreductase family protein [Chloroflexota bacterium]